MKIKVLYGFLYLAAIVLLITGCGKQPEQMSVDVEKDLMEDMGTREKVNVGNAQIEYKDGIVNAENSVDGADINAQDFNTAKAFMECAPSQEEKTVMLAGDSPHFSIGCVANAETVFLSQRAKWGEAAVYAMDMESDTVEKLSLDIPEDMDTNLLAVDPYGNLYVHLNTVYEQRVEGKPIRHIIWCLDEDYNVVREVDFTESAAERGGSPYHFCVDKSGNFYVQWGWHSMKALILDNDGNTLHSIDDESLGVDGVQAVGLNDVGEFSLVCEKDEMLYLADLDVAEGNLGGMQALPFMAKGEMCLALGAGTDTDRLLFSDVSGIWAYDTGSGSAENRNTFTENQEDYDIVVLQRMFLPDGRLCLLETVTENDELAAFRVKYVAGGK